MYRFERLFVWHKSVEACRAVYALSNRLPPEERYGMTSQLKRAVLSIPTNIAEGTGDDSDTELIRFLRYSIRSQHETVSLIKVGIELSFFEAGECEDAEEKLASTGRLLQRLKKSLSSPDVKESVDDSELQHDLEIILTRAAGEGPADTI